MAVAANARLHVSLLAKQAAVLLIRSARARLKANNCTDKGAVALYATALFNWKKGVFLL